MANLITNRHKRPEHGERPTVFTKRQASRRLRRNSLGDATDDGSVASVKLRTYEWGLVQS
jgi:hypothetical protein